ncbi:MAG: 4-hydroxythreonine-4-phosphate dehydrogenase PdxA [Gammaproteobacteria bacterium]|nr:4-hydroxythreonine-4-phosphate dehydrogenase PdxA [Gammaproteobacteria bacterium]MYF30777.1 4-hydroxythreonine-4-phosphate dehydrogenase PdxA [Gammaproteobacteria bacterium]MYK48499.1 4-hydroxythreonine-4-phosphate dehydrogenase PdxA [Gammaproteobacteria bacterium]
MRMAITMGDASGVGPEILLRRFAAGQLGEDVVAYGDAAILSAGARLLGLTIPLNAVADPEAAETSKLNVVDLARLTASDLTPGRLNGRAGAAARDYVERATRDALAGRVAGVVTLPMNKEATRVSTPGFLGHTEFIAALCGTRDYAMMLTTGDVAVSHVSAHVPLREAIGLVTPERIVTVIRLTHATLRRFVDVPRIAVCGLNPHAGEGGIIGTEDGMVIVPAIERARREGLDASGPFPADTVFHQAIRQDRFDAIVCMYHDQGHAPMKLMSFESAVNVTIGLPIVRTSVDHGTAFDIAWQGKAFTGSLQAALDYAWKLLRC